MKKINLLFLVLFLVVGMAATASAKTENPGFEIDGSFGFGTGPGDYDPGFGLNFGGGYTFPDINLQARVDISYFDFSYDNFYGDFNYTRIPITVSARYYFPINDSLKAFAQAGVETSVDSFDEPTFVFGLKNKVDEVNVGLSAGGGIEYYLVPQASLFALGRVHVISDNYFSMHFGGAFHF
jgi:opacity protein-like surface antigen